MQGNWLRRRAVSSKGFVVVSVGVFWGFRGLVSRLVSVGTSRVGSSISARLRQRFVEACLLEALRGVLPCSML